jgi:predicted O-methyltransferase YrrM
MFVHQFKLKSAVQRFLCEAREIMDFAAYHPLREMRKIALQQAVEYIQANMQDAIGVYTSRQLLDIALRHARLPGHFLEFGVFRGGTIRYIANARPDITVHGFDSFEGLPEQWAGYTLDKGAYGRAGTLAKVPTNVQLHKGWFDSTLPEWTKMNEGAVSFVHIDCDLYSSTKTIFEQLAPRMVDGTIIVFDDYFGYPNWKSHGFKAFQEFADKSGAAYTYLAYAHRQAAVRIGKR